MTPQPDRVAQVVAWLNKMAAVHRDYLSDPGPSVQEARTCLALTEFYRDRIEAGEPFKEAPDE